MEQVPDIKAMLALIQTYPTMRQLLPLWVQVVMGTMILTILRQPRCGPITSLACFADKVFLEPTMEPPANSDRMADEMADMSDLAYFELDRPGGAIEDAVERIQLLNNQSSDEIKSILALYTSSLRSGQDQRLSALRRTLDFAGFTLLDTIDVANTQGFVCRCNAEGEAPYVVIALRGAEEKVSDCLTEVNSIPAETKFIQGFMKH